MAVILGPVSVTTANRWIFKLEEAEHTADPRLECVRVTGGPSLAARLDVNGWELEFHSLPR